jgi:hypothetical protein
LLKQSIQPEAAAVARARDSANATLAWTPVLRLAAALTLGLAALRRSTASKRLTRGSGWKT